MSDSSKNQDLKNLLLFFPERAIEFLYQDYYSSLVRIAERRTHDTDAAEDIVQEAFTDIWENRRQLAQNKNVFIIALLYTMVDNRAINYYKRAMWLNESQAKYLNGSEVNTTRATDANLTSVEDEKPIWRIIATFPLKERECLTLKHRLYMSNEEIARHLKITIKGVERSVTSAYKRLRKYEPAELRRKEF
jgi:RNA polymerase sigma factor (sigma-70 family)